MVNEGFHIWLITVLSAAKTVYTHIHYGSNFQIHNALLVNKIQVSNQMKSKHIRVCYVHSLYSLHSLPVCIPTF